MQTHESTQCLANSNSTRFAIASLLSPGTPCPRRQSQELFTSPLLLLHISRAFGWSFSCSFFLHGVVLRPFRSRSHVLLGDDSRDKKLLCSPDLLYAFGRAPAEHNSRSQHNSCSCTFKKYTPCTSWASGEGGNGAPPQQLNLHSLGWAR